MGVPLWLRKPPSVWESSPSLWDIFKMDRNERFKWLNVLDQDLVAWGSHISNEQKHGFPESWGYRQLSSIWQCFSTINHPFEGTPTYENLQMVDIRLTFPHVWGSHMTFLGGLMVAAPKCDVPGVFLHTNRIDDCHEFSTDCDAINRGHLGVSWNGGTPIAGWFTRENPTIKWMRTGGTPISGNLRLVYCWNLENTRFFCFGQISIPWVIEIFVVIFLFVCHTLNALRWFHPFTTEDFTNQMPQVNEATRQQKHVVLAGCAPGTPATDLLEMAVFGEIQRNVSWIFFGPLKIYRKTQKTMGLGLIAWYCQFFSETPFVSCGCFLSHQQGLLDVCYFCFPSTWTCWAVLAREWYAGVLIFSDFCWDTWSVVDCWVEQY